MRKTSVIIILLTAILVGMASKNLSAQTKMDCPAYSFYIDTLTWQPMKAPSENLMPETYIFHFIHRTYDVFLTVVSVFDNGMKPLTQTIRETITKDPSSTTNITQMIDTLHLFQHDLINVNYTTCMTDKEKCLSYMSYYFYEKNRLLCVSLVSYPNTHTSREILHGIGSTIVSCLVKEIPAMQWDEETLFKHFTRYTVRNLDDKTLIIDFSLNTTDPNVIDKLTQAFNDPEQRLNYAPTQPEVVRALQLGYQVTYRFYSQLDSQLIGAVSFTPSDILR